jgi:hypothetical protein
MIHKPLPKVELPTYMSWTRSRGCAVADRHTCSGKMEFHHEPPLSQGGRDSSGFCLCAGGHREDEKSRHKLGRRLFEETFAINLDLEILRKREAYMLTIESGEAPKVVVRAKKTTRKNRISFQDTPKHFVKIEDRKDAPVSET